MGHIAQLLTDGWLYVTLFAAGSCLFTVVAIVYIGLAMRRWGTVGYAPDRQILLYGIPAKATIRSVSQVGTILLGHVQLTLQLEVQPPSGVPYMAECKRVVPYTDVSHLQPDRVILVKISPTDPSQVQFDLYNFRT